MLLRLASLHRLALSVKIHFKKVITLTDCQYLQRSRHLRYKQNFHTRKRRPCLIIDDVQFVVLLGAALMMAGLTKAHEAERALLIGVLVCRAETKQAKMAKPLLLR